MSDFVSRKTKASQNIPRARTAEKTNNRQIVCIKLSGRETVIIRPVS